QGLKGGRDATELSTDTRNNQSFPVNDSCLFHYFEANLPSKPNPIPKALCCNTYLFFPTSSQSLSFFLSALVAAHSLIAITIACTSLFKLYLIMVQSPHATTIHR